MTLTDDEVDAAIRADLNLPGAPIHHIGHYSRAIYRAGYAAGLAAKMSQREAYMRGVNAGRAAIDHPWARRFRALAAACRIEHGGRYREQECPICEALSEEAEMYDAAQGGK